MTDKVPLAEQIGALDEAIAEARQTANRWSGGLDHHRYERRTKHLEAAKATLAFLMNNRDEFLAFMAGKEGE